MSQTVSATLGTKADAAPLVEAYAPLGVDASIEVRFVYDEDGEGPSGPHSAGDAFDVSAYAWRGTGRIGPKEASPLFTLTEGSGIDASGDAGGVLVLTFSGDDLATGLSGAGRDGAPFPIEFDLRGTRASEAWFALRVRIAPQRFITRDAWDISVVVLGAFEVRVNPSGSVTGDPITVGAEDATSATLVVPPYYVVSQDATSATLSL